MLDVITGKDYNRTFGRQSAPQQRSADSFDVGKNFRVGHLAPLALHIALREEYPVWRNLCPMFERLTELVVITPELLCCADMDDASATLFKHRIEFTESHGPQRCSRVTFSFSHDARHGLTARHFRRAFLEKIFQALLCVWIGFLHRPHLRLDRLTPCRAHFALARD